MRAFTPSVQHRLEEVLSLCSVIVTSNLQGEDSYGWSRPLCASDLSSIGPHIKDLGTGLLEHLTAFGAPGAVQSIISTRERVIVLEIPNQSWIAGFVFAATTPLGVARRHATRLSGSTLEMLKPPSARATYALALLRERSSDPRHVLVRLALKAGIPLSDLDDPEAFDAATARRIERGVLELLELDVLPL